MTGFIHTLDIRIYYEDTDHGGVVYYANYLKFMERARTELLRTGGFEQDRIEDEYDIMFAVTEAHLRYLKPARFNDLIRIETRIAKVRGARILFHQQALHLPDERLLVDAQIHVASITRAGKVRRLPEELRAFFQKHADISKEAT
ncbi:MAG: tol-pal system-associated acyl-CoA thioesterase [Zetaproteobacteria bacterium]|nr:MAG: tol-pal system-associated acyl-CoA thioesterase [Zetaproteobacteria bacterium]